MIRLGHSQLQVMMIRCGHPLGTARKSRLMIYPRNRTGRLISYKALPFAPDDRGQP